MNKKMKKIISIAFTTGIVVAALSIFPAFSASAKNLEWEYDSNGKAYWYENGVKQGTYDDAQGILGDGTIRGREIFDPASNAWYWLDSCYDGAKAVDKEVWMPYTYQDELVMAEDGLGRKPMDTYYGLTNLYELYSQSELPATRLGDMVKRQLMTGSGKWVRYDENGQMMKGWVTIEGRLAEIYPDQAGNTYYYDTITGSMVKDGYFIIDGYWNTFNENGVLIASDVPGRETGVAQVIPDAGYSVVTADMYVVETEETTAVDEEDGLEYVEFVETQYNGSTYEQYASFLEPGQFTYKYYGENPTIITRNKDGSITIFNGEKEYRPGSFNCTTTYTELGDSCDQHSQVEVDYLFDDNGKEIGVREVYACHDCGFNDTTIRYYPESYLLCEHDHDISSLDLKSKTPILNEDYDTIGEVIYYECPDCGLTKEDWFYYE